MVTFLTTGWWGITETMYVPEANYNTIFHDEASKHYFVSLIHILSVAEWLSFLGHVCLASILD